MWMLTSLLPILIVCCAMYLLPPSWKKKKMMQIPEQFTANVRVQSRSASQCSWWVMLPAAASRSWGIFSNESFCYVGFQSSPQLPSRWPQGSALVDQNVGTRVFCWCSACPFSLQVSPAVYSVYTSGRRRKIGWAFAQEVGIGSQLSFLLQFLIYVCF